MDIKKKLQQTPTSPGIYIMKGPREKVIYVGKAKNLKNRLRSHFQSSSAGDERKAKMIEEVRDFEYIVTGNELEALILEATYIKRAKPKYNIILRDDKNYPYLKLTSNEEWPRLEVVRRIKKDGAEYFGPYVPAGSMWEMLKFIRRNFPMRICRYSMAKPFRPCVQHQMERCLAPCSEALRSEADHRKYMEIVGEVRSFIQGEKKDLLTNLTNRMQIYSDEQKYEEAAIVRDRIRALERAWELQRVIAPELGDMDVIGLYRANGDACVYVLFIRKGTIIGQKDFILKKIDNLSSEDLTAGFIEQFYSKELLLPPKIIAPVTARFDIQKKWLSGKRGGDVRFVQRKSELEKKVLKMADENAFYSYNKHANRKADEVLLDIKELLGLTRVPQRIGAVDISNISGAEPVGAFIAYEDGKFSKDQYRLFRIKTVKGIDDFAMMEEVVRRYMDNISDETDWIPDLLLIDGGKGQLRSALNAMNQFRLPVELAAIAKAKNEAPGKTSSIHRELERVYRPGKRSPVHLDPFQASTHLLQRIRDEVHRSAVTYHKKLRSKRTLRSPLEDVKGIGKTRRLQLLKHFGSIDEIKKASIDEIISLKGMNRKIAEELKNALNH